MFCILSSTWYDFFGAVLLQDRPFFKLPVGNEVQVVGLAGLSSRQIADVGEEWIRQIAQTGSDTKRVVFQGSTPEEPTKENPHPSSSSNTPGINIGFVTQWVEKLLCRRKQWLDDESTRGHVMLNGEGSTSFSDEAAAPYDEVENCLDGAIA